MKKILFISQLFLILFWTNVSAQTYVSGETFGRTLNVGVGVGGLTTMGYYGYVGRSLPVLNVDYEFDLVRNVTLAPFICFYSYSKSYISGGSRYYYHEMVVPIGVKGTYYFDELLRAGKKWDFYGAASMGFAIAQSNWDNGYVGDKNVYPGASPLFLNIHVGAQYHFNDRLGAFLDLSSNGLATIGLSIH